MKSEISKWIVWALAMATSLAGVRVSWDLTVNHAGIAGQTSAQKKVDNSLLGQVCGSFDWADCSEAAESPYAWFPFHSTGGLRIRTAVLGLVFFLGMTCWLAVIGWPSSARWWVQLFPLMATSAGLGFSLLLEYYMWTKLSKPCPLCIGTHLASLLLFIFTILLWPQASPAQEPVVVTPAAGRTVLTGPIELKRPWPAAWTLMFTPLLMLIVVVGGAGLAGSQIGGQQLESIMQQNEGLRTQLSRVVTHYQKDPDHAYTDWVQSAKLNIPIEGRPAKGPADARHTVVIFSDFQCPHCSEFEDKFNESIVPLFQDPQLGGVRVVFKHWPLNKACNPYSNRDLHPSACQAAYAAEAAYVLGGDDAFWKMHDVLFQTQDAWKESKIFDELADKLGMNKQAFAEAMKSDRVHARVKADIEEGEALGQELAAAGQLKAEDRDFQKVNGTPAVFVDGKRMVSPQFAQVWRRALMPSAATQLAVAVQPTAPAAPVVATAPAGSQPVNAAARIQELEAEVKKKDEGIDLLNKYYKKSLARYEGRWEQAYLAWQINPVMDINTVGRPVKGTPNARHTVVIFSDFECPTCKIFHDWFERSIYRKVVATVGLQVVYKHSPICQECNPYAGKNLHPDACAAAYAAEAAFILGGNEMFWRMHDLLYAKQDEWKRTKDFVSLARELGLNEQDFVNTMKSPEVKARVQADAENGEIMGKDLVTKGTITEDLREFLKVDGTPAIYVDNKRFWVVQFVKAWNNILGYVPPPRATTQPASGAPFAVPGQAPGQ